MNAHELWRGLGWPLLRLTGFISLGLLVGNLIEALNWTRAVSRVAAPLIRIARLKDISGASFSLAFFSGAAANTMLAEAHDQGKLSDREVVLSNLFNSLPTYFLHLPTIFFIAAPFIGDAAVVYVSLTVLSAFLRTAFIVLLGRLMLPPIPEGCPECLLTDEDGPRLRLVLRKTWRRFRKRLPKILYLTVPIYITFYVLRRFGVFENAEGFMSRHLFFLSWLDPQAMGIIVFHVASEFTAGLAAAGAIIQNGTMSSSQIVLALLVGNVLSSPMRAVRHQFPFYAGIFRPRLALKLIVYNQTLRALSICVVALAYYLVVR